MSHPQRIIIPGGSGQVGRILARHFQALGNDVTVLSRNRTPYAWPVIARDSITQGAWIQALENSDVCINLTGRSVNCRYNPANRREITESRVKSTQLLNQVIGALRSPPRVWLNASTATIYRHSLDRPMDEATGELGGNEPGGARYLELLDQCRQGLGTSFLCSSHTAHAQSGAAQRHHV